MYREVPRSRLGTVTSELVQVRFDDDATSIVQFIEGKPAADRTCTLIVRRVRDSLEIIRQRQPLWKTKLTRLGVRFRLPATTDRNENKADRARD